MVRQMRDEAKVHYELKRRFRKISKQRKLTRYSQPSEGAGPDVCAR